MLTVAIFTYKRIKNLNYCLESLDSNNISEILIFNDDENFLLTNRDICVSKGQSKIIKLFNPGDFGFKGRQFRKPIYLNKAVEICKNDFILFSDDDGIFSKGSVDAHFNALQKYHFSAGSIIRNKFFRKISKSILQGTNYAFRKNFYNSVGKYDESFVKSMGGGDVDFWYRIYALTQTQNIPVAFLPNAIQKVTAKSSRKKNIRNLDPNKYTLNKHGLNLDGPMYKWFPEIRDKKKWMTVING